MSFRLPYSHFALLSIEPDDTKKKIKKHAKNATYLTLQFDPVGDVHTF